MEEVAGQAAVSIEVEVAILDQERHLERRTFRQRKLALAIVADDPQAGEAGVNAQAGHAHDVVVIPEQGRPLVAGVGVERPLSGRHEILGPAIAGGIR